MTNETISASRLACPILLAATVLIGCEYHPGKKPAGWAIARHQLFVECMELAAKLPATHEGDGDGAAEVVDGCDSYALYMANSYELSGVLPRAEIPGE